MAASEQLGWIILALLLTSACARHVMPGEPEQAPTTARRALAQSSGYTLTVTKTENRGTWEGFGTNLAWWAHGVGGSAYQDTYADLFFTLKDVSIMDRILPGLGLQIVRYNIGGGGLPTDNSFGDVDRRPAASLFPWYKDIDGYWKDWGSSDPSSSSWDWQRDSNQRSILQAAVARGVGHVEFFAKAPIWWMTDAKSSAGGRLQEWNRRNFTQYLATVVQHARANWGVQVAAVEPFNEPSAGWWNYPHQQEGCTIAKEVQKEVLGYLREELNARGLSSVLIVASDENDMNRARDTWQYFKGQFMRVSGTSRRVSDLVGRVNVHAYSGVEPWRDNSARQALRTSLGTKRRWMSEYGDGEGGGMTLAQTIMEDLTHLRPTAWVYWQPLEPFSAWGLVNGQYEQPEDETAAERGRPTWIYWKYYVFAQFTRFLRAGYQIIGNSDRNSVVAYDTRLPATNTTLAIITVNYGNAQPITYDLRNLANITTTAASVTVTNTNGSKLLFSTTAAINRSLRRLSIQAEANTIYSIVINGVRI